MGFLPRGGHIPPGGAEFIALIGDVAVYVTLSYSALTMPLRCGAMNHASRAPDRKEAGRPRRISPAAGNPEFGCVAKDGKLGRRAPLGSTVHASA